MIAALAVALVLKRVPVGWAPFVLLAAPAAVVALVFARSAGPRWVAAVFITATFFGVYRSTTSVGRIHLRPTDIAFVALVAWVLALRPLGKMGTDIGQRQIGLLLGVMGLSLVPVLIVQPSQFFSPLVSWLRMIQTFSLAWLIPYFVRDRRQRRFVLGAVAWAAAAELVHALGDEALYHGFDRRLAGGNGTDTEGLLAAVLIVSVLYGNFPTRRWARFPLLALGLAGLALTQSIGAIVAVCLVVGLVQPVRKDELIKRALLRPLRIVLLVLAAIVAVVSLRPQNLPSSSNFNQGSTDVRLMAGAAGLVVFAHHPVLGVGFARSADPSILDTQQTSAPLHRWFPGQPPSFYPDGQNLSSVHNAYVQTAAEEGLVGLAVLLLVAFAVGSRLRTIRRSLADVGERADFQWASCILAVVLIWWNDNPLYGAQPETVAAAVAIGVLGSCWSRVLSRPSALAGAAAA